MDFGLREWLFIIGLLVIAGILFDGWRRMGGRSKIRFKLERNLADLPEEGNDELLGPPTRRILRWKPVRTLNCTPRAVSNSYCAPPTDCGGDRPVVPAA